ncbi:hypothetical protein C7N83_12995 [Neisseria iguanae]|uniref:Uncharacterized protein n=1 Tax=Neisseria iguanae TaxID=90242 RepID=A0A2P7TX38_9NEIS|nr:hypothetical protein C7N83_12995 [Neisseria iguanae]
MVTPELPSQSIVVKDNAAFHKRAGNRSRRAYPLPAVSDNLGLNPIEKMRAWAKRLRKAWGPGCVNSLFWIGSVC